MVTIRCALLSTILLAVVLSKATIDDEKKLFLNTIKRWDVKIRDRRDMEERFANLRRAKRSVDRSTSGVILESLNRYTVNNKAEQAETLERWARQSNATLVDLLNMEEQTTEKRIVKRDAADVDDVDDGDVPAENHDWEDLGFKDAMNQHGCGSCWAFAAVPVVESLQLSLTGYRQDISEQAIVDCIWGGIHGIHGCSGGSPKDLFMWAKKTQFLVSAEAYPYTGHFDTPCDKSKYEDPENNAMSKIWIQDWYPTSKTEESLLRGLLKSPVAFGTYISNDFEHYSGGDWVDPQCVADRNPHAMLLVGYTKTTLRVRNSRGKDWGENGYVNLVRFEMDEYGKPILDNGSPMQAGYLSSCKYFDHAYYITATERRDMKYKFCLRGKLGTRFQCEKSCSADGWNLAVIPTEKHLIEAEEMVNRRYPKVASDNKFNILWIGLSNYIGEDGHFHYRWADGSTPVNYLGKMAGKNGKYGLVNKNNGVFKLKNSLVYKARGLCSRALNCWDISKAVVHGNIEFNEADSEIKRSEGTVATVTCEDGCVLSGPSELTCKHGEWHNDIKLTTCDCEEAEAEEEEKKKEKKKKKKKKKKKNNNND